MKSVLEKTKNNLPSEQTQQANRKRTTIWERWDTNQFDFLSIKAIEEELCILLNISSEDEAFPMIRKAHKMIRESIMIDSRLGEQYLQHKYFRSFIESFTRLLQMLIVFQTLTQKQTSNPNSKQMICASEMICTWNLDDQKYIQLFDLSTRNELDFNSLIDLVHHNSTFSDIL